VVTPLETQSAPLLWVLQSAQLPEAALALLSERSPEQAWDWELLQPPQVPGALFLLNP